MKAKGHGQPLDWCCARPAAVGLVYSGYVIVPHSISCVMGISWGYIGIMENLNSQKHNVIFYYPIYPIFTSISLKIGPPNFGNPRLASMPYLIGVLGTKQASYAG